MVDILGFNDYSTSKMDIDIMRREVLRYVGDASEVAGKNSQLREKILV